MKFRRTHVPFRPFVLLVVFVIAAVPALLAEESSKKEQRLIKQLEQVTEVRTKYLAKMAEADSLIGVGDTLLSSLSEQMHSASQEMRAEAQRYAEEKKAVERMIVKVTRSEANELRSGMRELDAEYRQKLRDFDQFMRERIRESEQLLSTNNRSAAYKKEAEKGLREVERRMMELQLQLRPQTQPIQEQASIH
ncbi:hypothetical protein [Geofilum rhodophaeum]|uniref:hypothetical protein n=1 Tax=Geofilum rhodophaeum TaxID=1965019 RepID=UPI0011BA8CC0|nr:hypothetical protein [Geofilum rhodophaeum]